MVQGPHEHDEVLAGVGDRKLLGPSDQVPIRVIRVLVARRRELVLGDLQPASAGATRAELAHEHTLAAADIEDVPAGRRDQSLEHRDVARDLPLHGPQANAALAASGPA